MHDRGCVKILCPSSVLVVTVFKLICADECVDLCKFGLDVISIIIVVVGLSLELMLLLFCAEGSGFDPLKWFWLHAGPCWLLLPWWLVARFKNLDFLWVLPDLNELFRLLRLGVVLSDHDLFRWCFYRWLWQFSFFLLLIPLSFCLACTCWRNLFFLHSGGSFVTFENLYIFYRRHIEKVWIHFSFKDRLSLTWFIYDLGLAWYLLFHLLSSSSLQRSLWNLLILSGIRNLVAQSIIVIIVNQRLLFIGFLATETPNELLRWSVSLRGRCLTDTSCLTPVLENVISCSCILRSWGYWGSHSTGPPRTFEPGCYCPLQSCFDWFLV